MNQIVQELIEKGIATKNDDGSVGVVFDPATKIPSCILQKRDGTNLYATSDLACIYYRLTNGWNTKRMIYCVDTRQELHLRQCFAIARLAWPELLDGVELVHAANGAVVLPTGPMSTRKGNVVLLEKLIQDAFDCTKTIMQQK
jgi:arginyl-tRNA synthetase